MNEEDRVPAFNLDLYSKLNGYLTVLVFSFNLELDSKLNGVKNHA
jgi:hypothetical protein